MNSDEPELENAQSPSVPQMFGNFQNARAALGNLVAGGLQKMNLSANKVCVVAVPLAGNTFSLLFHRCFTLSTQASAAACV